jgi:hypothetical protein
MTRLISRAEANGNSRATLPFATSSVGREVGAQSGHYIGPGDKTATVSDLTSVAASFVRLAVGRLTINTYSEWVAAFPGGIPFEV